MLPLGGLDLQEQVGSQLGDVERRHFEQGQRVVQTWEGDRDSSCAYPQIPHLDLKA